MKAVVLGGAGVMGSYAVEVLSRGRVFSDVMVADIDEERGRKICQGKDGVEFVKFDAGERKSIRDAIRDADVVVNCVGPFYKFAPGILKEAIDSGVDYVDICDDYDATEEMLGMNDMAEKEGVKCVIGLGASPGITNVAAAYASKEMTKVDAIGIYVTRGIKEEAGGAIPYHMLHCWLGEIPVYINGERRRARGLVDGEEWVNFAEPFGSAPVYYFGHPETITLPRYIEEIKDAYCKGTFFPSQFREMLLNLQNLGLLSTEELTVRGNRISPLDFLAAYIGKMVGKMSHMPDIPEGGAVLVRVKGEKDGMPVEYSFSGTARMREATATPVAVGAEMMAEGKIRKEGVNAPEGCVPPEEFINRLIDEGTFGSVWRSMREKVQHL